jgi:hypothetical protein
MRWPPTKLARICAGANLLFALTGFLLLLPVINLVKSGRATFLTPNQLSVYWTMTLVNVLLLTGLVVGALLVWKMRLSGFVICFLTYSLEVLYFPGITFIKMRLRASSAGGLNALADSLGAVVGIGSVGLAPQFVTLYPCVAILMLTLAIRRLNGSQWPALYREDTSKRDAVN